MKIFLFGANGMLGNYVRSYLGHNYNIISLSRHNYNLEYLTIDSLDKFLVKKGLHEGDIIINCAGVIPQSVKQRNINTRLYFIINSIFPIILSMIAHRYQTKMIHITTDCVYSGEDGKYNEESIPDEINDYGLSKSLGDLANATIIRTSIIGEEINNKRSLLEWIKSNEGNEINGFVNHHWNGITCLQLVKIIYEIISKELYWNGVKHIFSPRSVSKYELISMINDIYGLNITIKEYETKRIDKTMDSIYDKIFEIPDLSIQINQLKKYKMD